MTDTNFGAGADISDECLRKANFDLHLMIAKQARELAWWKAEAIQLMANRIAPGTNAALKDAQAVLEAAWEREKSSK
ncbi:MAG: hypothetical protein KGJ90_00135 [Patescibacteria group bacterium]|nr:hypothetical protein [Patescibacteria group bacterium]